MNFVAGEFTLYKKEAGSTSLSADNRKICSISDSYGATARIRIYRDSATLSPLPLLGRFAHQTLYECRVASLRAVLTSPVGVPGLIWNRGVLPAMLERKETIDKLANNFYNHIIAN